MSKDLTNEILKGVNKEQEEAITYKEGPLLIIAGAGTGKTTVISRRIAWLVCSGIAKMDEILALTFTDKAAGEMTERVDILLPYGYTDVWISTFHAFGDRILRESALELGLNPDFQVLTKPEAAIFFREHLFEFPLKIYRPLSNPTRFIDTILDLFSRLRDEDISPKEYVEYANKLDKKAKEEKDNAKIEEARKHLEVALTYEKYTELLDKEGKVDFANQFYLALKILRSHPSILKRYQEQFKYILVDEFQDTNFAQFQLLKLLAAGHKNISVVSDDDQCLPSNTLIDTMKGRKKIKDIKCGDIIMTAVGKGHMGTSEVKKVFCNRKRARFLTFITETGHKVTVTSNHKMFCFVPVAWSHEKDLFYVYLMWRQDLGWRLGITDNLAVRLKVERSADKIIGLRAFKTEQEAQFFESLLAFKYGIPTVCFMKRKGLRITDDLLKKLYHELDTEERVQKLARDLDIDLGFHHYCLDAVTRDNKARIKINLNICYRRHISKGSKNKILASPSIIHLVSLETSDKKTIDKFKNAHIPFKKSKKGVRIAFYSADLKKAEDFANYLQEITGGILEYKFTAGKLKTKHLPALVMPASNVLVGHYLPIRSGNSIIYDRIREIKQEIKTKYTYDLEIDRTHNFIAEGVVVHNCIFRFRGAAYSNILNFIKEYPKAKQISLIQNYRSTQVILDTAYTLIQNNNPERFEIKAGINKKLKGVSPKGKQVQHLHFDTVSSEADAVAEIIEKKVEEKECEYGDFAILVRSNNDADPFLRSLNMKGIPWRFSGNQGLYSREEVRMCIAFLRVINNLNDSINLYYLASSDIYKIPLDDLSFCMHYAKRTNYSLYYVFRSIENIKELECVSDKARKIIRELIKDIEGYLEYSRISTTGRLLYKFLTESNYLKKLVKEESLESEEKIKNLAKFFDMVKKFELVAREDRLVYFINHLDMLIQAGDDPATAEADLDESAVNVLTLHKAKGLEFPVVFLVSLVKGKFPWPKRGQSISFPEELIKDIIPAGDFHIQEERRLFYVGMTRAKKELYLTSAMDYGTSRLREISPFVFEALGISKESIKAIKADAKQEIERFAPVKESVKQRKKRIPKEEILELSAYKIDDYLTCPLKYKYVHILRIPIMQHHTVLYGSAMHEAVENYYKCKMRKEKVSQEQLISWFEEALTPHGFVTMEHFNERLEHGKEMLKKFYEREEKLSIIPDSIEKEFSFMIGNNRMKGRWDRIDKEKDGAVIVDFKSSQVDSQKEADKKTKDNAQLSIYALAYRETSGVLPKRVELYFIESGIIGRAEKDEDDFEKLYSKIEEVSAGIRKQDFKARPNYMACSNCAFNQICPHTQYK